ncbi:MAG: hypothetical protein JF887_14000 [Candidatus Dormibacteraeota bacterium]|uniref:Uncharacterized protein n=1 Tax=Candidatus Amunia macphersoniae TaxID=3127014 RepID=A0A934NHH1_9BACT|nr:hypothetical protein [Candidatus Dormibacteraeota bacterium]
MDPSTSGGSARAEGVSTWWHSLDARDNAPGHPTRLLPATLTLAAAVAIAAMPLVWHHLRIPAASFYGPPAVAVFNGLSAASWLLVVAAFALVLAIRTYMRMLTGGNKWALTVLAFAAVNGMVFDYYDWSTRGVSLYMKPYYGPGFFIGLGGAALTVVAAIIAWRVPD